jgi:hypothetical protein
MAAFADRAVDGVAALERIWGSLTPQQVFRTDLWSLGNIGMQWPRSPGCCSTP